MTTVGFITELFYRVDNELGDAKHPLASLYASEIVTLGLLYALKGGVAVVGSRLSPPDSEFA